MESSPPPPSSSPARRHFDLADRPDLRREAAFIADNATIIGDVSIGRGSTVWFGAILRGDTEPITIGEQTNLQDGVIAHGDPGLPVRVGDRVTVGHAALLHGCVIEDDVLVGMRSTILNGARIGAGSVIGAGALVTENFEVPPGSIVMGVPAKVRGEVTPQLRARIASGAEHYAQAGRRYADELPTVDRPLR